MRSKICLAAACLFLFPLLAQAQNRNESLVMELYSKSGMEKQFQEVPAAMLANFNDMIAGDEEMQSLPEEMLSGIRAAIPEAFAPEKIRQSVLAELASKLAVEDMLEVIAWLDSPLGRKCTQLEEAASTAQAQVEIQQFAEQLKKTPPTGERLKLCIELDDAIKDTENAVELAIQSQAAVALAVVSTMPKEQRISPEEIAKEIDELRPEIEATVRAEMLVTQLYTYRGLTTDEIRQYIDFEKSPAGARYHAVALPAFKKAFIEGSVRWGKLVGESLSEKEGASKV